MGWSGPLTHKQYITWVAWLDHEWNRPNRSDHYIMELRCDVQRIFAKNPRNVKPDRLQFITTAPKPTKVDTDENEEVDGPPKTSMADVAKAVWVSRAGGNVEKRTISKEELELESE